MNIFSRVTTGAFVLVALFALASPVLAHSVVSPAQTGTSKYETFTLGVPSEKAVATVKVRLLIPETLDRVTPFVKPGWKITTTKDTAGKVTQIEWTGGNVPAEQKDQFQFTARTPKENTTLIWKAYQTYQNGEVVAWDQAPHSGENHDQTEISNPYSTTEVKDATSATLAQSGTLAGFKNSLPLIFSIGALMVSLFVVRLLLKKNV